MRPPWTAAGVPIKALEMDVVHRLLDQLGERDADGSATLGGCKVELGNGYVSCHWKGGRTNRELEEFALRMQQETGCMIPPTSAAIASSPPGSWPA